MKKKEKKLYLQQKKRFLTRKFRDWKSLDKPRVSVFRSHKHIYAQIIDDTKSITLLCNSSLKLKEKGNEENSFTIGFNLGKLALEKNINSIVFDCGKRAYHGRIEKLAEGLRKAGLYF